MVLIVIVIVVVLILKNKKKRNQQNIAAPPTAATSTIDQRENDLNLENVKKMTQSSSNPIKNENETNQYQTFSKTKNENEIGANNEYNVFSKVKDNEVQTYNKLVQQH